MNFDEQRLLLLEEIKQEVKATAGMTGRRSLSDKVIAAFESVKREKFIPEEYKYMAYANHPLPIGEGQTISQPYIVAIMTELLDLEEGDRVLEIGTGCGYQAAVLSGIAGQVYSVEVITSLAQEANARLKRLGYKNVHVKVGDGYEGWPENAPYDGVIVTAAAPDIPEPLLQQLKIGGKMVIPIGRPYMPQSLIVVTKTDEYDYDMRHALAVAFVPLTGRHTEYETDTY